MLRMCALAVNSVMQDTGNFLVAQPFREDGEHDDTSVRLRRESLTAAATALGASLTTSVAEGIFCSRVRHQPFTGAKNSARADTTIVHLSGEVLMLKEKKRCSNSVTGEGPLQSQASCMTCLTAATAGDRKAAAAKQRE
jgi:hypothetical protein